DAEPELALGIEQQRLIGRGGGDLDAAILAAASDDRQEGSLRLGHHHVVLKLPIMLLQRGVLVEIPWQHEFAFEDAACAACDDAVERAANERELLVCRCELPVRDEQTRMFLLEPLRV